MLTRNRFWRTLSGTCRTLKRTYSVVRLPCLSDFTVANEPVLEYRGGSCERVQLYSELYRTASNVEEIPIVIGGESICEGPLQYQVMPHNHRRKIAAFYHASEKTIEHAIDVAVKSQLSWECTPFEERAQIFMCAAELISTTYRQYLNAATMLGQAKTVIQAEIDAACELIDFFRFNAFFMKENAKYQPLTENPCVTINSLRFRGLEGFVAAISPFNFTAIGGNLAYTPALMGCSVVWKPSDTAMLSNWRIFNILRQAGFPDGVVNFVPANGPEFGKAITSSPHLAGVNFTGSVPTFNWLWSEVGKNVDIYHSYPRLVGELGGKNYHLVHPTGDINTAVAGTIRSAFEYSGQKCSACSRMYIPRSLYIPIIQGLVCECQRLKLGDVLDFSVFTSAVIDKNSFDRVTKYIKDARDNCKNKILCGGAFDNNIGYYIEPTIIETSDPLDKLMTEEIFGPILTIYTYEDVRVADVIKIINTSTKYALTGAVYANDKTFLEHALKMLRHSAGNFYVNDKSTGSVVGQQPFGGARKSGTNDKAGGPNYVMRWTSPQTIKETFVPQTAISYPYMADCDCCCC